MALITGFLDYLFHLDKHLNVIIQSFGVWTHVLLFAIIFAETGLVVTPFLPGDSLLFAVGAIAATGALDVWVLFFALAAAAVIGDSVNYAIGKFFGEALIRLHLKFIRQEYLDRTHRFYEKYGGKTIILARFVPIVRTFAPFVAGIGKMSYGKFFSYNVIGGVVWVGLFVFGGYYFGNIPFIKKNFSMTIFVIIFLSILPGIIEVWRHTRAQKKEPQRTYAQH